MDFLNKKYNLEGKTAIVTGAAGLLGEQHAIALLESGANVVLTDNSSDQLKIAYEKISQSFNQSKIISRIMDVTSETSIVNTLKNLHFKRVDILINNAAIDPKFREKEGLNLDKSRVENFEIQDWNKQLSVGLTGAFLCSKIIGSSMAADGIGGVILNIASDLSIISPDQRLYEKPGLDWNMQPVKPITYSVIKFGLIGMTKYLATYWADRGVRVNALSPGGVINGQGDAFIKNLSKLIPMGRMAHPEEYRCAVQFLCSDASSYMNGHNLIIDGGRSVW